MATKSAIDQSIDQTDGVNNINVEEADDKKMDSQPSFKKYPESRIPISKSAGALWKSRYETATSRLKNAGHHDAWDEAVKYYKNDQTGKRNRDDPDRPGKGSERHAVGGGAFAMTENVVFANVSALVPSIYAKNPDVSVQSSKGDAEQKFAIAGQKVLNVLMQKRTAPGLNLKPKMRRAVVMTTLTNISYIEVGYTRRELSSDQTLADIDRISEELSKEDNTKQRIEELEGELQALDDVVDLLQPAGPWSRFVHPKDIVVDGDSTLPDHSDAKWIMARDVIETSVLNAIYRKKNPDTNLYESIYKPTHVLKTTTANSNIAGHDDDITNFSLLQGDEHKPRDYGFEDDRTFKRAQRTYVWRVWDRITRRVYMYAEHDWTWPIWVWDDPYGLDDFIPIYPLAFHSDPEDMYARGEASYYLDQQDEINRINSQVSKMRSRISNMIVYDKRSVENESELTNLVKPTGQEELVGVTVTDGHKLSDMLMAPPIPAVDYAQLFDKRSLMEAIDRVSGVPAVVKGVEFRTNTTNKAIDSYESTSAQRLDEKIDAIEEIIGRIGNAVLVMCLQFMTQDDVRSLVSEECASNWPPQPLNAKDAQRMFQLTVTGGSSLKPTSKTRKAQAQEIGQLLGQFGASNPIAFFIMLKVFARAYSDELVLEYEDWEMIIKSTEQQLMAQQKEAQPDPATGGAPGEQGAAPQSEQPPVPDAKEILGKVSEMFKKMPDKVRVGVGQEIAKGVPLEEILSKLQHMRGGSAPQPNPN